MKKLRDALESLKGRVAGRNKDDVEEAISMVSILHCASTIEFITYNYDTPHLFIIVLKVKCITRFYFNKTVVLVLVHREIMFMVKDEEKKYAITLRAMIADLSLKLAAFSSRMLLSFVSTLFIL